MSFKLDRRSMMTQMATWSLAGLAWRRHLLAAAPELRKAGKACILLWMQGGPSQFETFAPKVGAETGGPTRAIATNVAGIQFAEHLPHLAKQADKLCVIRSMSSREGAHPRATQYLHSGYLPTSSVRFPVLGAHVAQALGNASDDLPGFVRIGAGQTTEGGGFLGVRYNPLAVPRAGGPPSNSNLGFGVDEPRFRRRLKLLADLQSDYASAEGSVAVADQDSLVDAAARMVLSPEMKAFSLENESESMRRRYGEGGFADGCLLARRLVESGVPFVEVQLGGWDTHRDNFDATASLCGKFDQPMAALLDDLQERGLLESTLVVWMGEFGRTPRINANSGRDHYPKAFNVALGGCGIRGGQVIGETDELGVEITDRPVRVPDLFHTIFHALEIDASEELQAGARPVKRADEGEPVREALLG